jgi:MFS family permease
VVQKALPFYTKARIENIPCGDAYLLRRYLKYIIPSVVFFGYTFGFRMFYAFSPLHLKGLGLSQAEIGILMAVYPFSLILLSVPIGLASDRFSPRTWAVAGLFAMSASVWSLSLSNSFYSALLSFCGIGLGATLYTVGAATLYFKSLGNTRQGVKLALYNALAALGYGLGPFTGSLMLGAMNGNMRALFPAAAVIVLPFAFLMLASRDARLEPVRLSSYIEDLRNPRVRFLLLIVFLFSPALRGRKRLLFAVSEIPLRRAGIAHRSRVSFRWADHRARGNPHRLTGRPRAAQRRAHGAGHGRVRAV